MRFELFEHQPIDYSRWDFTGQGKNLTELLTPQEMVIWAKAMPNQDQRDDTGHGEIVTYFTLKLSSLFPEANRAITVPAAILHDTGYSPMLPEEKKLFYSDKKIFKVYEPALRARHQQLGVEFARKTLEDVSYEPALIDKICEIISEHDTRKGFLDLNDGIVRDADKLWRFTLPEVIKEIKYRDGFAIDDHWARRREWLSAKEGDFFYSPVSREIARIEFDNMLQHYSANKEKFTKEELMRQAK
ncbi:HD domain-containing protein [Candidatus Woesearchaeota archaeon]|nr:HD domain-containing protein [Candidatus Woesearchaeota archaeon]